MYSILHPDLRHIISGCPVLYPEVRYQIRISGIISVCPVSIRVVVIYHLAIIAIGHGLLKKCRPLVIGCVLRSAGSGIILSAMKKEAQCLLLPDQSFLDLKSQQRAQNRTLS